MSDQVGAYINGQFVPIADMDRDHLQTMIAWIIGGIEHGKGPYVQRTRQHQGAGAGEPRGDPGEGAAVLDGVDQGLPRRGGEPTDYERLEYEVRRWPVDATKSIERFALRMAEDAVRSCPALDENGYICEKGEALKALRRAFGVDPLYDMQPR